MIDGRVRFSEIDHTRKITVPSIINYFQDCSTFQSEDIGVGLDVLSKKKKAWILTYWQIVIDHYPKMNDKIQVSTWASKFKGMLAERNFCMTDENGEKAAYAQMAMEMLDQERVIRQVRVEYKKSAVLGDMIVPRTGDRDGRTVVELCTTEGELYAAVEFAWV